MTLFDDRVSDNELPRVFVGEFGGNVRLSLDSTAGWSLGPSGVGNLTTVAAEIKEGTAAISYDKIAGGASALISTSTAGLDLSNDRYWRVYNFLSSLADVASGLVRLGNDPANYRQWIFADSILSVGWTHLRLALTEMLPQELQPTGVTESEVGAPDFLDTIDYVALGTNFDAAGDLLSGILWDALTAHPFRYASRRLKGARAPTKFWMKPPTVGMSRSRAQEGILSIASASVPIVDHEAEGGWGGLWAEFGEFFGGEPFIHDAGKFAQLGRAMDISQGFTGDDETDDNFQPIHKGTIRIAPHRAGNMWTLQVADNLDRYRVEVFKDATDDVPITFGPIHPLVAILQIGTSTGNGTNGIYDVLSADRGAAIPQDLFAVSEIEDVINVDTPADLITRVFPEAVEFLALVKEITRDLGLVPKITNRGLLSFVKVQPVIGAGVLRLLDYRTNILRDFPNFTHNKDDLFNRIRLRHSFNVATDEFDVEATPLLDADSIAKYGERTRLIESKVINTTVVADIAQQRHLFRSSSGPPPIPIRCTASEQDTEVGELVRVTHPQIPDLEGGFYGVEDAIYEVIGTGFDPSANIMNVVLADTRFEQNEYRKFGPVRLDGVDFDDALLADTENYAWFSSAAATPTLGDDADPSHVFAPP